MDYVFNDILEPHQQIRIKVSLGLEDDPSGAGYNVNQSKIAIGSGGLSGKGFLNGTQTKLKYVPEQDTDFIFCTVGEEQGFLGASAVLIVFGLFILRLIVLAERQDNAFGRVYGYSVASIAKERQGNADNRSQSRHHADINRQMEKEYGGYAIAIDSPCLLYTSTNK